MTVNLDTIYTSSSTSEELECETQSARSLELCFLFLSWL